MKKNKNETDDRKGNNVVNAVLSEKEVTVDGIRLSTQRLIKLYGTQNTNDMLVSSCLGAIEVEKDLKNKLGKDVCVRYSGHIITVAVEDGMEQNDKIPYFRKDKIGRRIDERYDDCIVKVANKYGHPVYWKDKDEAEQKQIEEEFVAELQPLVGNKFRFTIEHPRTPSRKKRVRKNDPRIKHSAKPCARHRGEELQDRLTEAEYKREKKR